MEERVRYAVNLGRTGVTGWCDGLTHVMVRAVGSRLRGNDGRMVVVMGWCDGLICPMVRAVGSRLRGNDRRMGGG